MTSQILPPIPTFWAFVDFATTSHLSNFALIGVMQTESNAPKTRRFWMAYF